jgi:hypothetical protein
MKRTVEYKVSRDLSEYTSGQHRLPGMLFPIVHIKLTR